MQVHTEPTYWNNTKLNIHTTRRYTNKGDERRITETRQLIQEDKKRYM
jgi:hypothetical protein